MQWPDIGEIRSPEDLLGKSREFGGNGGSSDTGAGLENLC